MANFFKNLKPKADLSRHGFDLSQRHVFSMSAGMILPVLNLSCVPGDYHEIRPTDLLRAMPIQTAAFTRCKQVVDFFFVPYIQLWQHWNSFINQRVDPVSATYQSSGMHTPAFSPCFDLSQTLYNLIQRNTDATYQNDINGFSTLHGSARLLDLLGYCNIFPFMCNTKVGDDSPISTERSVIDEWQLFLQRLNARGYKPNLWPILAYQKIWSDFYRNPYWDTNVDTGLFNVDDLECDTEASSIVSSSRVLNMLTLRYHGWKKDYFTSLLPTQQFGEVSVLPLTSSLHLKTTTFTTSDPFTIRALGSSAGVNAGYFINGSNGTPANYNLVPVNDSDFSVIALRRAEALQAWKEKVLRAGYRSKDNSMAHFGVTSDFERNMHPTFLGSVSQVITIDDVTATAQTNTNFNGSLGDLGGKGVSFMNDEVIKFKCSDFGVLMACAYVIPETEYNSNGIERDKQYSEPFDYFTPEFQNLGLEPVTDTDLTLYNTSAKVIGYAPRYYGYKSAYDKVHGVFVHENAYTQGFFRGSFRHWVSPLDRFQDAVSTGSPGMSQYNNMYVTPSVLDSIFYTAYDGRIISDQFVVDMNFDIKSVRPMSVLGLPNI